MCEINPSNLTLSYIKENQDNSGYVDEEISDDNLNVETVNRKIMRASGVSEKINKELVLNRKATDDYDDDNPGILIKRDPRFQGTFSNSNIKISKTKEEYKLHPNNLIVGQVPHGISERFIGYFRMEDGLLW